MPLDDDRRFSGVVEDLALHPDTTFAVVIHGRLLPIRFAARPEAVTHLVEMLDRDRFSFLDGEVAA